MLGQPQARNRNWLPQPPFVSVASSLCGSGKDKALKSDSNWREGQRKHLRVALPPLPFKFVLLRRLLWGGGGMGLSGRGADSMCSPCSRFPSDHKQTTNNDTNQQEAWLSLQQNAVSSDWDPLTAFIQACQGNKVQCIRGAEERLCHTRYP